LRAHSDEGKAFRVSALNVFYNIGRGDFSGLPKQEEFIGCDIIRPSYNRSSALTLPSTPIMGLMVFNLIAVDKGVRHESEVMWWEYFTWNNHSYEPGLLM